MLNTRKSRGFWAFWKISPTQLLRNLTYPIQVQSTILRCCPTCGTPPYNKSISRSALSMKQWWIWVRKIFASSRVFICNPPFRVSKPPFLTLILQFSRRSLHQKINEAQERESHTQTHLLGLLGIASSHSRLQIILFWVEVFGGGRPWNRGEWPPCPVLPIWPSCRVSMSLQDCKRVLGT